MSQCSDILQHMQSKGPITPIEALNDYGCFRLAARINDLREAGHDIKTSSLELPNGKVVAQYSINEKAAA